jgi:hypothetical protein
VVAQLEQVLQHPHRDLTAAPRQQVGWYQRQTDRSLHWVQVQVQGNLAVELEAVVDNPVSA